MIAFMRNVQTGEIREVEADSDEFKELQEQVYDHGGSTRPAWEQTGGHHTRRVDEGRVHVPEDLGYDDKPAVNLTTAETDLRPDPHPERQLTAAERKAGVSSYEEKMRNLGHEVPNAEATERGLERVGREGGQSSRSRSGDGPTVKELREQAKEAGIEGYSSMNKADLQDALGGGEEG